MKARAVSAMLKVDEHLAEDALMKATEWCEAVSGPDPTSGVTRAAFSVPTVAYNPLYNTFSVSVRGEIVYDADQGPMDPVRIDTALRESRLRWEWAASLKARSLGVQILRLS